MKNSRLIWIVVGAFMASATTFSRAPLSFEERVKAQEAIERVYYNHRIWPKENPGPKPPFEEMVPREVIEAKVIDYLKKCFVLEQYWHMPIQPEHLQAEINRMVTYTNDSRMLSELLRSLDYNPNAVAECIARPLLADRIIREMYCNAFPGCGDLGMTAAKTLHKPDVAFSETIHRSSSQIVAPQRKLDAPSFDEWWETFRVDSPLSLGSAEDYQFSIPLPETIWNYACDEHWNVISEAANCPTLRFGHTAVWTGAEMIIWGGENSVALNTGGMYYPSTDSWISTSITGACPSKRASHSTVWTGTVMIVWGGCQAGFTSPLLNSGGAFNPALNSWAGTSTETNCPTPRALHSAVWTGTEMIVWGGTDSTGLTNSGGRYNLANNAWVIIPSGPSARRGHTATWTGQEMIVWGGWGCTNYPCTTYGGINSGGRYLASGTWTSIPGTNAPTGRYFHTAIWTGQEMIVWGGIGGGNTGSRLNRSTMTWSATSTGANCPPNPGGGNGYPSHTAVWTGSEMIIWGGGYSAIGGRYNPAADSWASTSEGTGCPQGRTSHSAVWTGNSMIIWGGMSNGSPYYLKSGGIYYPKYLEPPIITGPTDSCDGDSVTLSTDAYDSYQWKRNDVDVTGEIYQSIAVHDTGSYSVWVEISDGCSAISNDYNVIFHPVPIPIIYGASEGCANIGVDLSVDGFTSYQWIKDGTDIPSATSQTYTAMQSGAYSIRVTDSNSCFGTSSTKAVTINPLPTPTVIGATSGCVSPGVALSAQSYNGYQWLQDGNTINGATSQNYTATATGAYSVRVTDSNGCVGTSVPLSVTVYLNPTPSITGSSSGCINPGVTLSTGSFSAHQWNLGGNPIPGATAQNYTATQSGTYTVTVTESHSCSGTSAGFAVTIWAPAPTITGPVPACVSATLSTQAFSTYQWFRNETLISGAVAQSYFAPTTGSYTVNVTDSHGCTGTSPAFVVSPLPTPAVSGNATGCPSVVLSTTAPYTTSQWRKDSSDIPGATGATYEAFTSGSYSVRVTDASGCAGTSSDFPVAICVCALSCTASASPTTGQAPLAVNFSATATPTYCTGQVAYSWTFGDGQTSTQQNPSHTYATAGTYNWSMTASVQGVTCTKSGTITVTAVPVCSLACTASASPSSGQAPLSVTFTSTATPTNCAGTVAYSWALGDGQTSTLQNPSHIYASAGIYNWTLTASIQGTTCTKSGTVTVTAVPVCSLSCTAMASPSSGTAPLAVSFTSTGTPSNCTGTPTFAWGFGDGATSTEQNPSHTYTSTGTYNWTLTASVDGVNCSQSGTVTVTGDCSLTCAADVSPTTGQAPLSVTYEATATPANCTGDVTYAWAFGDGGSSTLASGSHTYESPGTYPWTMTASVGELTCSKSGTVTVTETPTCSVTCAATVPASSASGMPVSFAATAAPTNCTGSPTFAWTFGDGGSSPLQNPHHTYSAAGSFTWTMTATVQGVTCTKSGVITITSSCTLACDGTATPSNGMAPLAVSFSGTATPTACAGTPTFFWDFGDGETAAVPSPTHTYTHAGTYAWTLVVTADGVQCVKEGLFTATANPNPSILTVGGGSGPPGGTVTVPVTLAGRGALICSLNTDISFDPAVLSFSSAAIGPAGTDAGKNLTSSTPSAGVVRLGLMGFNATPIGDGDVAYVSFTVAAGATGSKALNHACGASDCAGAGIATSCPGGLVTFTSGIPGDCDSNGQVSIGEVQKGINMFLGSQAIGCGVDCNGDGTVSIGEVQKVINAFLGAASSC